MSFIIRPADAADLDRLVPLFEEYRRFYGCASAPQQARAFLAKRFARGDSTIFIAEAQAQALGFTQLYPSFSSASMARILILNDLLVLPEARGQGVATALIGAAAQFARDDGAVRMTLATQVTNTRAQRLYESLGWQRDELFHRYNFVP